MLILLKVVLVMRLLKPPQAALSTVTKVVFKAHPIVNSH